MVPVNATTELVKSEDRIIKNNFSFSVSIPKIRASSSPNKRRSNSLERQSPIMTAKIRITPENNNLFHWAPPKLPVIQNIAFLTFESFFTQ